MRTALESTEPGTPEDYGLPGNVGPASCRVLNQDATDAMEASQGAAGSTYEESKGKLCFAPLFFPIPSGFFPKTSSQGLFPLPLVCSRNCGTCEYCRLTNLLWLSTFPAAPGDYGLPGNVGPARCWVLNHDATDATGASQGAACSLTCSLSFLSEH